MSYPDPYHPQQQPPPGQYPPAPPGPPGYGYPPNVAPNGGYPPAQPYGAQPQPPYYPPAVPPQPETKQDNGNSRFWRILDGLMWFVGDSSTQGFGKTARDRVMTVLMIFGITFGGIVVLVVILASTGR